MKGAGAGDAWARRNRAVNACQIVRTTAKLALALFALAMIPMAGEREKTAIPMKTPERGNTGRITNRTSGTAGCWPKRPNARHLLHGRAKCGFPGSGPPSCAYISMVLRIRPTASPSISKASPGLTTMVLKSGFSGSNSMRVLLRRNRLTVTSSPRRATTI